MAGIMADFTLRKVTSADAELLFDWANDIDVRQNSFSQRQINWQEHCNWLERMLGNAAVEMYILLAGQEPAGQVRLETVGEICRINYSIVSKFRGQGYGKVMLALAENMLAEQAASCKCGDNSNEQKLVAGKTAAVDVSKTFMARKLILQAEVKAHNVASQLVFEALGYSRELKKDYIVYHKENLQIHDISAFVHSGGVLLLANNRNALGLYYWLAARVDVCIYSGRLTEDMLKQLQPRVIISYNYEYIIPEKIIAQLKHPVINLHCSYLPYNRGANPNFWSFIDHTPKGVTIHEIVPGLDKGGIIAQRLMLFDEGAETLASSYDRLQQEIVKLFQENWDRIRDYTYTVIPQQGKGTYHGKRNLLELMEKVPFDWEENVGEVLLRVGKMES